MPKDASHAELLMEESGFIAADEGTLCAVMRRMPSRGKDDRAGKALVLFKVDDLAVQAHLC